ncbi:MAG TPA: hypothetical protein VF020_20850 [Chthoniobacterales bacterium]
MREHLAVLEGLFTRDPRRAADAIAAHILRSRTELYASTMRRQSTGRRHAQADPKVTNA